MTAAHTLRILVNPVRFIGPRIGLADQPERIILGSAQTALTGLFMIWWAFLALNSGRYRKV
jgi:hypothetical protein